MAKANLTELKHVEKWSFTRVTTIFSAILGFLGGFAVIPYLRVLTIGAHLIPGTASLMTFLQFLNLEGNWLALFPFLSAGLGALQGFLFGIITAIMYNLFAKKFGGIRIKI